MGTPSVQKNKENREEASKKNKNVSEDMTYISLKQDAKMKWDLHNRWLLTWGMCAQMLHET